MKVQRLRVKFRRGEQLKYISHLDIMRAWERVFRRAEVPLSYSQGFTPHPQISLAAPLPVGVVSEAELMDVYLEARMTPRAFIQAVSAQAPPGLEVHEVEEVAIALPSLQSAIRWSDYDVLLPCEQPLEEVQSLVDRFLALETLDWEYVRENKTRRYDIRSQVAEIRVEGRDEDGNLRLWMRLQTDTGGSGRPEQVTKALGLPSDPAVICRVGLHVEDASPARAARKAHSRFQE